MKCLIWFLHKRSVNESCESGIVNGWFWFIDEMLYLSLLDLASLMVDFGFLMKGLIRFRMYLFVFPLKG